MVSEGDGMNILTSAQLAMMRRFMTAEAFAALVIENARDRREAVAAEIKERAAMWGMPC